MKDKEKTKEQLQRELKASKYRLDEFETAEIERKHVEESLRKSEEKYRMLVENIQEGVFIIQDAKFQFVNEAFARTAGYQVGEIIGRDFSDFVAPEDFEMVADRYSRRQAGENVPTEYEFCMMRKDGTKIIVNMNVGVVTYNGMVASMGILKDITESKRIEKALRESEEKYRALFEATPVGIGIADLEGRVLDGNVNMLEMTGFTLEELKSVDVGATYVDLDERKLLLKTLQETGRVRDWEVRLKRKDGTIYYALLNADLLEPSGHKVLLTTARDITERKKAEKEKERLFKAIDSSTDGITIADEKDRYIYVNAAYAKTFGYAQEELVGKTWRKITPPELIPPTEKGLSGTMHNRDIGVFNGEVPGLRKDGTEIPTEVRGTALWDENGNYLGHICIVRDITERKTVEEKIRNYTKELEESNRMKELFADIMHHDLLNPLTTANGFIELLKENEVVSRKKAYLETIERSLVKGMELIDSAMKYSRFESLKTIELEELDLKKIIEGVIEALTPLADNAGMEIINRITLNTPVRANKIIEEVFSNLISNAIKYASSGKRIIVESEDEGESLQIRVIDFGEGIKESDKTMIFERFRRGGKTGVKGSGLGLAIAGKIMELHNGRIWVEDNPEGGSIFIVELPL